MRYMRGLPHGELQSDEDVFLFSIGDSKLRQLSFKSSLKRTEDGRGCNCHLNFQRAQMALVIQLPSHSKFCRGKFSFNFKESSSHLVISQTHSDSFHGNHWNLFWKFVFYGLLELIAGTYCAGTVKNHLQNIFQSPIWVWFAIAFLQDFC